MTASLLADPEALTWLEERDLAGFGRTVVAAPHPDDETLGCGGLIASLRAAGMEVAVVVLSDGTGSHPNSRAYPPDRLRALREAESLQALALLGVPREAVTFLRLRDRFVPHRDDPGFEAAVADCADATRSFAPATVLAPWRRDPHPDHRATFQIVRAAIAGLAPRSRLVEYPIWAWVSSDPADLPAAHEVVARRLDIRAHLDLKRRAVRTYRSQTTDLIADDPEGFRLADEFLAHFDRPYEVFLEERA